MKITFQLNKRYSPTHSKKQWSFIGMTAAGRYRFQTADGIEILTELRALETFPQVWNLQLSERWGFDSTLLGKWTAMGKHLPRLDLMTRGMKVTDETPLIPVNELEATCNDRGFTVAELCRWSGYSRNSLKSYGMDEKRVVRLWDLINGAKETYVLV